MSKKIGFCLSLVLVSLISCWTYEASAEPMRVTENLRNEKVFLPDSAPDRSHLVLGTIVRIRINGELVGLAAIYNDREAKGARDYTEVFDITGRLLAVQWIDRFGIVRNAVDEGLLDGDNPESQGLLFLLMQGASI